MKITIYELLGLVKDGKEPKQIVFDGDIYTFNEEKENYYRNENTSINWDYVVMHDLSDRIEIIKDKKISKINRADILDDKKYMSSNILYLSNKINEIIDKLNEMGDK